MEQKTRTFEKLDVWKKGRELRKLISSLVEKFPEKEKFDLVKQMVRASRSVTANIAEGYGRFYYKENIQFCRQARGSLFELIDHFSVAQDEGYLEGKEVLKLREEVLNLIRLLNGYINYLDREKKDRG